jgi:hypothetical protein
MALTKVTSHFITGTITNDTTGNAATVSNGIYTNESHSNPSWITGLAWSKISGAPAFITGITSSNVTTALGFTPVTNARQITINGTSFDLSADRSWTITSMIYPSTGIPISTGSGWGSSITNNSANWNTAYGWGNHASAGYITSADGGNAGTLDGIDSSQFLRSDGNDTFNGNLTVGSTTRSSNTVVRVLSNDSHNAGFEAYGNSQGTGYLYVGQDASYGGGISYNGDGSPLFAMYESADKITFFRRDNNTTREVFSYPYNTDTVTFNGAIYATSGNFSGNIIGKSDNTTEVGTYSTGAIKRIRMAQGGELHFGDTTTSNFLGLTEGAVNNFGDQDRLGLYCRNELKIYGNSNLLKVTIPTSGNITFAEGATFSGAISASNLSGTNTGDQTNITGNAATATTATNFNNGAAYSSGSNVYVDTLESINTNDWLELVYYGGLGVRIGTGANGSKALYANALYAAGNAVIHSGNIGSQSVSNATNATNAGRINGGGRTAINVGGSQSTYYPVALTTGSGSTIKQHSEFVIERGGYDQPGYSPGGFTTFNARFSYKPSGWGYHATNSTLERMNHTGQALLAYYEDYYHASQFIVWLRGGTRYYLWSIVGAVSVVFENTGGTSYVGTYITFTERTTIHPNSSITRNIDGSVRAGVFKASSYFNLEGTDGYLMGGSITSRTAVRAIDVGYASSSCYISASRTSSNISMIMMGASSNQNYIYNRASGSNTTGRTMYCVVGTTNAFYVHGSSGQVNFFGGTVGHSDRLSKRNIEDSSYGLDAVNNLRPRRFFWKNEIRSKEKQIGFIAQEVEEVLPEAVRGYEGDKGILDHALLSVLTKAVQELSQQVIDLKAEVELLKQ